jgi:hypothetical protein
MFGIRDLKDATLRVIGQEDLAIAIRIISGVSPFGGYVSVGHEHDEATVSAYVAHDRVKGRRRR